MVRLTYAKVLTVVPILMITVSNARPNYPSLIPNGQNPALPCMEIGHIDCIAGGPRNQFGLDFAANGRVWDETLCMMDSDGDGITNGAELGDPCCTWREGDGDAGLRTDNISNPGDPQSTEAEGQDGCPTGGGAPAGGPPSVAPAATPAAPPTATVAATLPAAPPAPTGMEPPKLMNASPVPTGVYEQTGGNVNPLMAASPVPTGVYPEETDEMMAPDVTGAPLLDAPAAGAPAESLAPVIESATPSATPSPVIDQGAIDTTPTPPIIPSLLDAAACFPADATVTLKDGSVIAMRDLKIGDEILAKMPDTYSPVYMFSHKESESINDFLRISTSKGLSITVSPGHYIFIDGSLKAAAAVRAGDKVSTRIGKDEVVGIEAIKMTGLYNPHTLAGSLVVDGVLTSDVTTAVKPSIARTLLAPFKLMYAILQRDVSGGFLHNGWASLAKLAPSGAKEL